MGPAECADRLNKYKTPENKQLFEIPVDRELLEWPEAPAGEGIPTVTVNLPSLQATWACEATHTTRYFLSNGRFWYLASRV